MRAAIELIEQDGADAVSMRRVAAALRVAPMSLYNHVPNKAALLDGVAEQIMSEMDLDLGSAGVDGTDWPEQARALARNFRAVARRYPRSVLLVITRQPRTSVGLRPVELALGVVRTAGFDDRTAVRLVRTFVSFVLGSMLHEAGTEMGTGTALTDPAAAAAFAASLDQARYPQVRAVLPLLVEHDHETDFEFGLELLVNSMRGLLDARCRGPTPRDCV